MLQVLNYQKPLKTNKGLILSIDEVIADYSMARPDLRQSFFDDLSILPLRERVELLHWESKKIGTFHDQFSIRFEDGRSFWIGVGLNEGSVSWNRLRLKVNPNKVGNEPVFLEILNFLKQNTRSITRSVRRFDLAIDIPVDRSRCFLVKDRRMYIERRHGEEYTQYLGAKSSTVGRVKLYNKKIEAKLDYPLTRLELTLDPAEPYEKLKLPMVYYLDQEAVDLEGMKVSETDRFMLNALLQGYGSLADLGRKTKKKMTALVDCCAKRVYVEEKDYIALIQQLKMYV